MIWTADLAYVVGLTTTDGSLSKDGRHIDFTSKDKELIKSFAKILKLKNRIGSKYRGEDHSNFCYRGAILTETDIRLPFTIQNGKIVIDFTRLLCRRVYPI